ncbi:hypothetical protein L6452_44610 [Arctium lappa]|uniref:Uncharacterized protein n=1 Tax=Arctium lappa TaxID=4217 RepID=A0ACB8XGK4_ARCLA|nr:hypothetical protein L6452_44610 [Arctium lappa]
MFQSSKANVFPISRLLFPNISPLLLDSTIYVRVPTLQLTSFVILISPIHFWNDDSSTFLTLYVKLFTSNLRQSI